MLHIGGQFAQELKDYHQKGYDPIIFVEADPINYEQMKVIMEKFNEKNNCKSIPVLALVTDKNGQEYDFNRHTCNGGPSSIFKTNPMRSVWKPKWKSREKEVVKLQSTTVKTLLRDLGIAPGTIKHLVVDVQGAELLVLKGVGEKYFEQLETIQVEVSRLQFYTGGVLYDELNKYLESKGFKHDLTKIPDHGNILYKRI